MRTAPEAIAFLKSLRHNVPNTCQHVTWVAYQSHAVGDVDGDGDADAVDGWLAEPKDARHFNRRPAIGGIGSWGGGSSGHGHRATCTSYDHNDEPVFTTTDGNGEGNMADRPLSWFDKNWPLVHWLGWTDTISGQPIKGLKPAPTHTPAKEDPVTPAKPKKTRGPKIDRAIVLVSGAKAKSGSERSKKIKAALNALLKIDFIN